MPTWLRPLQAALDAAPAPCPFFFRDDDAGWYDEELIELLDLFARREVPVDVAVIPVELHEGLVRLLANRAKAAGVRLHQHGYAHLNHEPAGRKCEFGPSRACLDQEGDIAAGRRRLLDMLGPHVDPIFTPPWNRCTAETAGVLVRHGLRVLSRDHSAVPVEWPGLAEVPVTVDWFGHRRGVRWTRRKLAERMAEGVVAGGPVGVMLHHALMTDSERAPLDELLGLLVSHPAAAATTIMELAG